MDLLYISDFKFSIKDNKIHSLSAYSDAFWQKYLDVFSKIHVVGVLEQKNTKGMIEIRDNRISISFLPQNHKPHQFFNDFVIKKELRRLFSLYNAIIIKPSSRKGMIAIKIAEELKKPYMIEMTGDIESSLSTHNHLSRRLYAPFIFRQIKKTIRNCKFGLYVTSAFLQKKYPISGLQCGCTDTNLEGIEPSILAKRIKKINESNEPYRIGLIGMYHDNRKGLDTAIKALSRAKHDIELHVLGNGEEKDRKKWIAFANKQGFRKLFFDGVLNGSKLVFDWIDACDLIILPSRSEGLPRCIVEAMSRGCPCVTSNVCGLPELIDEKWTHNPNDYLELSKKVDELLSEKNFLIHEANCNFEKSKKYVLSEQKRIRNDFLISFKNYCETMVK